MIKLESRNDVLKKLINFFHAQFSIIDLIFRIKRKGQNQSLSLLN